MILTSCISEIKTHVINIVKQFLRGIVDIYFGLFKTQVGFLKK